MNKTFKVVFSKTRNALMVVNEATSCVQAKGTKTVIATAVAATIATIANGALAAESTPARNAGAFINGTEYTISENNDKVTIKEVDGTLVVDAKEHESSGYGAITNLSGKTIGQVNISGGTFEANSARKGGAATIYQNGREGSLSNLSHLLDGVTFSGNSATDAGGAIAVSVDGSQVAQLALPAAIETGTVASYAISVLLTGAEAGSDVTVGLSLAIDWQTDADASNNVAEVKIAITDDVLAYDQTTEDMFDEMYAVGSEYGEIMAATSMHLANAGKLTGITVGWAAMTDEPGITLAVYKYDADNLQTAEDYYGSYQYYALGDEMFSASVEQGAETGWVNYEIEPVGLEAGDYLLCVGFTGFAIACDMTEGGMIYTVDTSYGEVYPQSGLGTPAIRAILGPEATGVSNVAGDGTTLALYPNPASETVVIAGQGVTGADFYSMAGVQVGSAAASAAGEVRYDVSGLAPGIYVAKVQAASGIEVKRFIVK